MPSPEVATNSARTEPLFRVARNRRRAGRPAAEAADQLAALAWDELEGREHFRSSRCIWRARRTLRGAANPADSEIRACLALFPSGPRRQNRSRTLANCSAIGAQDMNRPNRTFEAFGGSRYTATRPSAPHCRDRDTRLVRGLSHRRAVAGAPEPCSRGWTGRCAAAPATVIRARAAETTRRCSRGE